MGQSYYYFVSSLPLLSFEQAPPMTYADFLKDCEILLSIPDYQLAKSILDDEIIEGSTGYQALDRVAAFNRGFQNDLTVFRAERAHKDGSDYTRGTRTGNAYYMETIQQAAKQSNLLAAEKMIDQLRWQEWDYLTANCVFSVENIIVFGLKLKMLEKYQDINSERGGQLFEEISNPEFIEQHLYSHQN